MEDKRVAVGLACYARRRGELSEGSTGYTRTPSHVGHMDGDRGVTGTFR